MTTKVEDSISESLKQKLLEARKQLALEMERSRLLNSRPDDLSAHERRKRNKFLNERKKEHDQRITRSEAES